jgi:hypothetical protein
MRSILRPVIFGGSPGVTFGAALTLGGALGLTLSITLSMSGCAHVEPPSGGPEDKARPEVAAVYPAPGAVNVPRDARVVFQFNEWLLRTSARGQVLLSPPTPGRLRVEVDGDRVIAQPPAGAALRARTTYTAVAMGGLQDLHGNALTRPFALRFSTGPALDSAAVGGRVVGGAGRGSLVVALYRTDDRSRAEARSARDTGFRAGTLPEPWRELPAYLAAADSAGDFLADGAAAGDYALLAFEDVNGDLSFDAGLEPVAVGEPRVALSANGPRAGAQTLRLAPLDTLPLRIAEVSFEATPAPGDSAAGTVSGWVSLKFTRDPHPVKAAKSRFRVLPDSGAPIPVEGAAWSAERSAWLLAVPPLKPGTRYRVAMRGRPDFPGRDGLDVNDTSAVFVPEAASKAAKDNAKTAEWKVTPVAPPGPSGLPRAGSPRAGTAQTFSSALPLTEVRWENLTSRLEARLGADTTPKPLRPRRDGLTTFSFDLPRALRAGDRLELILRPAPGKAEGDSVPRTLYSGAVPDSVALAWLRVTAPADRRGWTFWASPATGDGKEEIPLERAGAETLQALVSPGLYRVQAFLDRDKDGVRDPGSLRPWVAQEPVTVIADTVRVEKAEP